MKLLEIPDDLLCKICKKLDHQSLLQFMLTCKRVENLIGQNPELFEYFVIRLTHKFLDENFKALLKIRRSFGVILIAHMDLVDKETYLNLIKKILKRTGPKLPTLKILNTKISKFSLLEILGKTHDLQCLFLEMVEFNGIRTFKNIQNKLKNLKYLYLEEVKNPAFIADVIPDTVTFLQMNESEENWTDWNQVRRIFEIQQKNHHLILSSLVVDDFEYSQENCSLYELSLDDVVFRTKEAFKKFSDFMKLQKNILKLKLDITSDELESQNDYSEIMTHLLNIETLDRVNLCCTDHLTIFTLKVHNKSTRKLVIDNFIQKDFSLILISSCFPNLTSLELNFEEPKRSSLNLYIRHANIDLTLLNLLLGLKVLKLNYVTNEMLKKLELPQLQEFVVWCTPVPDLKVWKKFTENCPKIQTLQIFDNQFTYYHVLEISKNFQDLKHLECGMARNVPREKEKLAFNLISDFYKKLNYMILKLRFFNNQKVATKFQLQLPEVSLDLNEDFLIIKK